MKRAVSHYVLVALLLCATVALGQQSEVAVPLSPTVRLKMKTVPFIPKEHKIQTCKVLDWEKDPPCLIDGRPIFGTDWEIPTSQLEYARLEVKGIDIELDVTCLYNTLTTQHLFLKDIEGGYLLGARFSDGAGSYRVEWTIINGASVRTLITNDENDEER